MMKEEQLDTLTYALNASLNIFHSNVYSVTAFRSNRKMRGQETLFSSKNQYWNTPKWLFDQLNDEFHFKLDAATTQNNPLGTRYFCTPDMDGLIFDWVNPTFCNPPYGRKNKMHLWLEKAVKEQSKGVTSVFLLPSRTGTKWFHEYIYQKPNVEIRFLKGRVSFDYDELRTHYEKSKNTAPFDSMIVIFRGIIH
jgi:site-specific DNA-methyltransferase (adenine-specific)